VTARRDSRGYIINPAIATAPLPKDVPAISAVSLLYRFRNAKEAAVCRYPARLAKDPCIVTRLCCRTVQDAGEGVRESGKDHATFRGREGRRARRPQAGTRKISSNHAADNLLGQANATLVPPRTARAAARTLVKTSKVSNYLTGQKPTFVWGGDLAKTAPTIAPCT